LRTAVGAPHTGTRLIVLRLRRSVAGRVSHQSFNRGSRASRSPLPRRLNPSAVM
jgi:hypothetical protein